MWGKLALVSLFVLTRALAQEKKDPEEEKKKDDEAKAKLADFRKDLKASKAERDFVSALEKLGEFQHPKILAELKVWMGKSSGDVALTAAEQVAKYRKDKDACEALTAAAAARKEKDLIGKFLRLVGELGYKPATPKLVGYFRHKEADVAKEAMDACGKLKSRDAIDPLLNVGRELDGIRDEKDNKGGGIGGGGLIGGVQGGVQNEQQNRKKELLPAALSALEDISGQKFKTIKDADQWWRQNKGTFKDLE